MTITPDGIRDTRVAAELIPWRDIDRIWTWEFAGQHENRLTLTKIALWSRGANLKLGVDGLGITAAGLKIDYPTLYKTTLDHAQASQG